MFSLVGILPNRIIQPVAEHSQYPVERLGMIWAPSFYWNELCFIWLFERTSLTADRGNMILTDLCIPTDFLQLYIFVFVTF